MSLIDQSHLDRELEQQAGTLQRRWAQDARWQGIERSFAAQDVIRLRGRVVEAHTLARRGAERLTVGSAAHPRLTCTLWAR